MKRRGKRSKSTSQYYGMYLWDRPRQERSRQTQYGRLPALDRMTRMDGKLIKRRGAGWFLRSEIYTHRLRIKEIHNANI